MKKEFKDLIFRKKIILCAIIGIMIGVFMGAVKFMLKWN